ncbi:MAG: arylesterase [Bdellovibrionales bacterium]|nr:arylesterase [Bdellovibrionales bacterium]
MKIIFFLLLSLSFQIHATTVLILGDSLTEGFQLEKEDAFPAVIERNLKPKHPDLKVVNGGVSGATTASGYKRLNWYVKAKPDILVLALGSNDGLRGMDLKESEKNLSLIIEKAQAEKMKVLLVGMKMPTNYGEPYRTNFEKLFPTLAKKYKVSLVPFLLDGVGGNPKLNISDGIHPNPEGHKIMARIVQKELEPML